MITNYLKWVKNSNRENIFCIIKKQGQQNMINESYKQNTLDNNGWISIW
jgi:hypothetical protein